MFFCTCESRSQYRHNFLVGLRFLYFNESQDFVLLQQKIVFWIHYFIKGLTHLDPVSPLDPYRLEIVNKLVIQTGQMPSLT